MKIQIASRTSPLALLQTNQVISKIQLLNPNCECSIVEIRSEGDLTDKPLHLIGGKGLFVSKLEAALSEGIADFAVHSLKDVPALLDTQFAIAATMPREEVGDALLLREGLSIDDLSGSLKIATSGPRRKSQLLSLNSKLSIIPIRGNIQTRINKMTSENLDGLIVAKAALNRLNIMHSNIYLFSEEQMLPAASQGAIGIEIHKGNLRSEVSDLLSQVNDSNTLQATEIERSIVAALEGGCLSPISALCKIDNQDIELKVRVSNQNGSDVCNEKIKFTPQNKQDAVSSLIKKLIANGAKELIQS